MAEPRRRTFGPVLLVGVGAGALLAVAGGRAWAVPGGEGALESGGAVAFTIEETGLTEMSLVSALGLVVLATWGVLLVTRGRARRALAVLGLVASLGVLVTVVVGSGSTADALRRSLEEVGASDTDVRTTGWFWAALVAAVLSVAATALAVRLVPGWPEMGSRYDAPTAAAAPIAVPPEELSNLDLWKAMDEGRDPTEPDPE